MAPLLYLSLLLLLSGVHSELNLAEEEEGGLSHVREGDWDLGPEDDDGDYSYEDASMDFKAGSIEELVVAHAPFLRFHKTEGENDFCFPHDATDYYNTRVSEDWSRQCNMNYSTLHGEIPTYWHAQACGEHLHIAYWTFTGYNHKCDLISGERDAWWEFIVVKVRNWETAPFMAEVMFGQKEGWYTRVPGRYDVIEHTHPVAFVGHASHGFYHDDGGSNSCCYFEDLRNPGLSDTFMRTHLNLVELKDDGTGEEWMTDPSVHYWSGILAPTYRDNWDLCRLLGCTGSYLQICGTCGCHKSDIGGDPF
ncbi:uncharacterized protein LOC135205345 isoform X2 [Macrobrachium nipponense]|uniref:uncharacterized protein LOC135205345 isoform X2 n=1 Tax=Macrobrachium nipponense TaxID=159736 RepID=UPI0030C8CE56